MHAVIARNRDPSQVHEYERNAPKDVVQLDPSAEVALMIRFGAHRGEYMFHCHNLVHEDHEMMRSFMVGEFNGSRTESTVYEPVIFTVDNVLYDSYKDYWNPMLKKALAKPTEEVPPLGMVYIR